MKTESRYPAETFIVSYPKSGRTWVNALIGEYLCIKYKTDRRKILNSAVMTNIAHLPILKFTHDNSSWNDQEAVSEDKTQYEGKNVLILQRDIKDILVSAYWHTTTRQSIFKGTISEFIRTEKFGVKNIIEFYDTWKQNKHTPNRCIFIQYEQLHNDITKTVNTILKFIGENDIDRSAMSESIERCSFQRLQKAEREDAYNSFRLRAKHVNNYNSYKVRRGKVGAYVDYLSVEDIIYIDNIIKGNTNASIKR